MADELQELRGRVEAVLAASGLAIDEEAFRPGRPSTTAPIPSVLQAEVRAHVAGIVGDTGLYSHQAHAITAALAGKDVALATATASGKSLAFMAAAASILKSQNRTRILCLYPAVALIHDQLQKWKEFLGPLNLSVDYVAGEVPTRDRAQRINAADVVFMTPDVTHAWAMSHLDDDVVATFLKNVRLLVLDEAHVYDGVFGTNMAYFLRRLLAILPLARLIVSTATIAEPEGFVKRLTGRDVLVLGPSDDGAPSRDRVIVTARPSEGHGFETLVRLTRALGEQGDTKFLAFADSRVLVERIVAAAGTPRAAPDSHAATDWLDENTSSDVDPVDDDPEGDAPHTVGQVLPYRAGYEDDDRKAIESALRGGRLRGVVSTSALELGLDIGDIDVVVLFAPPPSVKAFWQRIGRAGRQRASVCVVVDEQGLISRTFGGLNAYLERPLEPNWLYLDNTYLQYAQALCAANEISVAPWFDRSALASLPSRFSALVDNELDPKEAVPTDLYPLKQSASEQRPQYAFPLRGDLERQFNVLDAGDRPLGSLSHSQALREAYPGAIYYYMARPYRVKQFSQLRGEIRVQQERNYSTQRINQVMVFPRFPHGVRALSVADRGFVVEADLQVSERVTGFTERRGSISETHLYEPGSAYEQRPLLRFFDTSGICWVTPVPGSSSGRTTDLIVEALCLEFGIQPRDIGHGSFSSKIGPVNLEPTRGECVYDATRGSLRLTAQLADHFTAVLESARRLASTRETTQDIVAPLEQMHAWSSELRNSAAQSLAAATDMGATTTRLIARGQRAIFLAGDYAREVTIKDFRFTPVGVRYELDSDDPALTRFVPVDAVVPTDESTSFVIFDPMTGDTAPER